MINLSTSKSFIKHYYIIKQARNVCMHVVTFGCYLRLYCFVNLRSSTLSSLPILSLSLRQHTHDNQYLLLSKIFFLNPILKTKYQKKKKFCLSCMEIFCFSSVKMLKAWNKMCPYIATPRASHAIWNEEKWWQKFSIGNWKLDNICLNFTCSLEN